MNKAMREQLKDWQKVNEASQKKPQKRREEVFTDADMRYLMGTGMPRYRRYRGSFRQR